MSMLSTLTHVYAPCRELALPIRFRDLQESEMRHIQSTAKLTLEVNGKVVYQRGQHRTQAN